MKNFELNYAKSDIDMVVFERTITGRITEQRWNSVLEYTKQFNENWDAPYGTSPRGYAYTCGCEHDCCGHLITRRMGVECGVNVIKLWIVETYNY